MNPADWIAAMFLYAVFGCAVYIVRLAWIETYLPRPRWVKATARLNVGIVVWPVYLALLGIAALVRGGRRIGRTFRVAFGPSNGGESDE